MTVLLVQKVWFWWKPKAHAIGVFQTNLVLVVFYYLVFVPVAGVVRLTGDPLKRRGRLPGTMWRPRRTNDQTLADLNRQS